MASVDHRSAFAGPVPAWKAWLAVAGVVASLIGLAALLVPAAWRPSWLGDEQAQALSQLTFCGMLITQLVEQRDGRWSAIRPAERVGLALVCCLLAISVADTILESFGLGLIPATWRGRLVTLVLVGGFSLFMARVILRQMDEARPRRRDIAMGE